MEYKGLSGPIRFDHITGRRNFLQLEIVELSRTGFKKIGAWDPVDKISYSRSAGDIYNQMVEKLENKTFRVTARVVSTISHCVVPVDIFIINRNLFSGRPLPYDEE